MENTLAVSQPVRVFVLELVSSGFFGDKIGDSFRAEGRAMLDSVLDDLRSIPDVASSTIVDDPESLRLAFNLPVDVTLCIAPEFDDLLRLFCEFVCRPWMRSLNCDSHALSLCGDKWWFAQHLQEYGIPAIPTGYLNLNLSEEPELFPCVVKPRYGAGSWLVRCLHEQRDWESVRGEYLQAGLTEALYQPLMTGTACSIAALIRPGLPPEILPVAAQRLSSDGRFCYLGGVIPAPLPRNTTEGIRRLLQQTLDSLDGWNGYIGCDVIVSEVNAFQPVIVELNPRLTTSYIGYRMLCEDNLMERLLFADRATQPLRWRPGRVLFDADGTCRYAGSPE